MKCFWLSCLFLISFFLKPTLVLAVIKESGDLRLEYSDPLFISTNVWYPGRSETAQVKVENLSIDTSHSVAIRGKVTQDSEVAEILTISIYEKGVLLWGPKTLKEFSESGEISLSALGKSTSTAYDLLVGMDSSLGNDYQNKSAKLDFIFGFLGTGSEASVTSSSDSGTGEVGVISGGTAGVVLAEGPAAGFEVLGEEEGEVAGAATGEKNYLWWLLLGLPFGFIFPWRLAKKLKRQD